MILTGGEGREVPPGPVAVYVKLTDPEKPVAGVKVTVLPAITVVPLAGGVAMAMLVDTPVICAVRLMATGVLNAVVTLPVR